jgi:hypothetical protein
MKRAAVTLLALLRVLAVVLGLQLSGVGHFATELVEAVVSDEVHHETCPADGPCDDCPPGCPQCHCSNGLRSVAPDAAPALASVLETSDDGVHASSRDEPPAPELPLPFRPPRTAAAV